MRLELFCYCLSCFLGLSVGRFILITEDVASSNNRVRSITPVNPVSLLLFKDDIDDDFTLEKAESKASPAGPPFFNSPSNQFQTRPADGIKMVKEKNHPPRNIFGISGNDGDGHENRIIEPLEFKMESDELKPVMAPIDKQLVDLYQYFNQQQQKYYHQHVYGTSSTGTVPPQEPNDPETEDPINDLQEENNHSHNNGTNKPADEVTHELVVRPQNEYGPIGPYYPQVLFGGFLQHNQTVTTTTASPKNVSTPCNSIKPSTSVALAANNNKPVRPTNRIPPTPIGILLILFFFATPVLLAVLALAGIPDIVIISIAAIYIPLFIFTIIGLYRNRSAIFVGRSRKNADLADAVRHITNVLSLIDNYNHQ